MKVTLDLSQLVETGKLTPAEAERLRGLAARDTGSLGINILVGFGIVAVAAGIGALVPSVATAIALGGLLAAIGFGLLSTRNETWGLLAQICLVIGSLAFCGGLAVLDEGALRVMLLDVLVLMLAGVFARSGLLIAVAVLSLGACLGSSTDYWHAMYSLDVEEPTFTILVFSAIALVGYGVSLRVVATYERLALIAARVAVLMVNFGFWVGSLWGDDLVRLRSWLGSRPAPAEDDVRSVAISAVAFGIAWAVTLLVVGVWAVRENRRWIVNTVAVFAGIHFYTQWFEKLGANPGSVLVAGLLMLAFALGLWSFNRRLERTAPA